MSSKAITAASQKPALLIHGFLGVLRNTNNKAIAVKADVYLLKPAKPNKIPAMIQSPILK